MSLRLNYTLEVKGRGTFPIDMLRHSSAYPADPQTVENIEASHQMILTRPKMQRTYRLHMDNVTPRWADRAIERFESFGYLAIVERQEYAEEEDRIKARLAGAAGEGVAAMKIELDVKCPNCGQLQRFMPTAQAYPQTEAVVCEDDGEGCGALFAVEWKRPKIEHRTFKLVEVNDEDEFSEDQERCTSQGGSHEWSSGYDDTDHETRMYCLNCGADGDA